MKATENSGFDLGVPCVESAVGGTPCLLKHDQEGLVCTLSDPYSMASYIHKLLTVKGLAFECSRNIVNSAFQRHNREAIVNNMTKICNTLSDTTYCTS